MTSLWWVGDPWWVGQEVVAYHLDNHFVATQPRRERITKVSAAGIVTTTDGSRWHHGGVAYSARLRGWHIMAAAEWDRRQVERERLRLVSDACERVRRLAVVDARDLTAWLDAREVTP